MDPAGIGVLIGIGIMVGGLFGSYIYEHCVRREEPHLRPLLVVPKPRFVLHRLIPKSSISHRTLDMSQTSSSVHLPIASA